MIRSISRRAVLTALGGLSAVGVTGVTSAQETTEEETEQEPETTGTETGTEIVAKISPTVRLIDYQISGIEEVEEEEETETIATITAEIECDTPELITTSDLLGGVSSQGVTRVSQKQETYPSGRSSISMQVGTFESEYAAMGIGTSGGAVTVSTGLPTPGAEERFTLAEGITYGGGTAVLGTGIAAWRKTRSDLDEPEEADLDG